MNIDFERKTRRVALMQRTPLGELARVDIMLVARSAANAYGRFANSALALSGSMTIALCGEGRLYFQLTRGRSAT